MTESQSFTVNLTTNFTTPNIYKGFTLVQIASKIIGPISIPVLRRFIWVPTKKVGSKDMVF